MANNVGIFDAAVGIQDILPDLGNGSMPQARPLVSTALAESGLDGLYLPNNHERLLEAALRPDVGDGDMLRASVFSANLRSALRGLEKSKNPKIRSFVREDLRPLIEDSDLMETYLGLMMGG